MALSKKIVIELMKKYEVFRFYDKPIKLSSGKYSDFYIDMRKAAGIHVLCEGLANLARDKIFRKDYEQLIGLELYGGVYAHIIGMKTSIPSGILRKEAKEHGMKKLLEGYIPMNPKKILLIDDVLTTGNSLIKGIELLSNLTYTVKNVFVLVDRQEGGRENLESRGINLESLFLKEELI